MQELIVISGMSGSGKTIALRTLEDLNFYCVDNLPIEMLPQFAKHVLENNYKRVSVGVDVRSSEQALQALPELLADLKKQQINVSLVFLTSDDSVILSRYSETRRAHPLSSKKHKFSLSQAIKYEREIMEPVAHVADLLIDTSQLTAAQLRQKIWRQVSDHKDNKVSILLESFAFKRGVPYDADFVFDARCLPNPFWEKELREYCGKDKPIQEYLESKPIVQDYFNDIRSLISKWLPSFEEHDRSYITIAIGCTGGKHRSVFIVEKLAKSLKEHRKHLLIQHRELD